MAATPMHDVLEGRETLISGLLDGQGSVELVDVYPRLAPEGYGPEYMPVRAARVSFGMGLKTPEADNKLLEYLLTNQHTSPFEMCGATFRLHLPKAIAIHFLRHRTFSFNEFSQRYAEVGDAPVDGRPEFYRPVEYAEGIRLSSDFNKQGSRLPRSRDDQMIAILARDKMIELDAMMDQIHKGYHDLCNMGVAKEIARFYLPCSEYTTLFMHGNIHNFMKMFKLRADHHAQHETVVYARAMMQLLEPIFPKSIGYLKSQQEGMYLTKEEIESLRSGVTTGIKSVSGRAALTEKAAKLGLSLDADPV